MNTLVQNDIGSSLLSLQSGNLGHFVSVCLNSVSAVADICADHVNSHNNVNVNHVYFIYINAFYRSIVKLLIYVPKFVLYTFYALYVRSQPIKMMFNRSDIFSPTHYLEQQS